MNFESSRARLLALRASRSALAQLGILGCCAAACGGTNLGSGGTGGGGSGGGALPACVEPLDHLTGDVTGASVDPNAPELEVTGAVLSVEPGLDGPEVTIEIDGGAALGSVFATLAVPGLDVQSVTVGETLTVERSQELFDFGVARRRVVVTRAGELVAAFGQSDDLGFGIAAGEPLCETGAAATCDERRVHELLLTSGGATVVLGLGVSVEFDGMFVTSEGYWENSNTADCEVPGPTEWLVGVSAP